MATKSKRLVFAALAQWKTWGMMAGLVCLLGGLVASGGAAGTDAFPFLLLLNPADVFRILNIFGLDEVRTMYGLTTVFPAKLASPALLGAVMLAWIALPLGLASWRFRR